MSHETRGLGETGTWSHRGPSISESNGPLRKAGRRVLSRESRGLFSSSDRKATRGLPRPRERASGWAGSWRGARSPRGSSEASEHSFSRPPPKDPPSVTSQRDLLLFCFVLKVSVLITASFSVFSLPLACLRLALGQTAALQTHKGLRASVDAGPVCPRVHKGKVCVCGGAGAYSHMLSPESRHSVTFHSQVETA